MRVKGAGANSAWSGTGTGCVGYRHRGAGTGGGGGGGNRGAAGKDRGIFKIWINIPVSPSSVSPSCRVGFFSGSFSASCTLYSKYVLMHFLWGQEGHSPSSRQKLKAEHR